ncbi:MAG: hypothetical protein Q4E18_02805 [Clostridia bacterium]|nr:hypothetical protein [Clostridia bacterium]
MAEMQTPYGLVVGLIPATQPVKEGEPKETEKTEDKPKRGRPKKS